MYNSDTEMIFPLRVIPSLQNIRGNEWKALVTKLQARSAALDGQYAFVLLLVRLGGCTTCNADSYRAMRGCTLCAKQSIRRFRGSDEELISLYNQTLIEVNDYLEKTNFQL